MPTPQPTPQVLQLTELEVVVRDIHHLQVTVEPTGGGTQTLYVGVADPDGYYEVAVGPFDTDGISWAGGDLCVGPDPDGPHGDGFTCPPADATVADVARLVADVVAMVREQAVAWTARCGRCGETFEPVSLELTHFHRVDGTDCGGIGRLQGHWTSTSRP